MSEYEGKYDQRLLTRCRELEQAWDRDQSVIEEQRQETGKLKSQINQLLQKQRALREENKRLRKALKLARETVAEEVQHAINSYGNCSMTRCAKAELAEIDAALEGPGVRDE